MSAEALTVNARIWENLYRRNAGDLSYPNDVLVRLGTRLFGKGNGRRMLATAPGRIYSTSSARVSKCAVSRYLPARYPAPRNDCALQGSPRI